LVAQRFAASGRKNGQCRTSRKEGFYDLPLALPEMSMAEVLEEFGVEVVVWRFHFVGTIERSGNASAILGEKQKKRDSTGESLFWQIKLKALIL
jgi:hypothetical protein